MIANLVHETATPAGALSVTVAAGTDDGDMRISDRFPVGATFYYMMKSSTASNDDSEEGIGTVTATGTFDRTVPQVTFDGTTLDSTSPARLTFTTAVDVWATPSSNAIITALPNISSVGTRAVTSTHITDSDNNQTKIAIADRLMLVPYLPSYIGQVNAVIYDITAFAGVDTSKFRLAIFETDPATGDAGNELWQSADLTPAVGHISTTISPSIEITGASLYVAVIRETSTLTLRAAARGNAGPTQCGQDTTTMRHIQALIEDSIAGAPTIPASSSFTLSKEIGLPPIFALEYV